MAEQLWRLIGEASREHALSLEAALEAICDEQDLPLPTLSYFEQRHTPLWKIEIFFLSLPEPAFIGQLLERSDMLNWPYVIEDVEERDWVSESQKLLNPVEAGQFYLYGSHDAASVPAGVLPILMEAGQAFGTGRHETTWTCLKTLDTLASSGYAPKHILDLGTGSGVLAIAAQKLWPDAHILATDIDPIAVDVTRENCTANTCAVRMIGSNEPGIATATADGLSDAAVRAEGPFDLIIANILAAPLIHMAGDIERVAKSGATILLSGLLVEQKKDVLDAYEARGLRLVSSLDKEEWTALQLQKQ